MFNILFFVVCLVGCVTCLTMKEDLEIEQELTRINKVPLKSIHTKFGDIVDCIDIYKQPAFDHPLLKDHKLQKRPSFKLKAKEKSEKTSSIKAVFGLQEDKCPPGTVPIKRTTKNDLIGGKSYFNNGLVEHTHGNHYAEVISKPGIFESYNEISGISSVYNINAKNDQTSSSVMYVRNGPDSTSYIGMGWHVAPQLYNDDATHLYIVWTTDNFKTTGCFNLQCSGFVQTSPRNYLGGRFENTSIYGGHMIEITISITQDPQTQDWMLFNENEMLGYFPATLFSNLKSAHQVGWGGRTSSSNGGPSPPMGSGYFPDHIYTHASYFRYVTYKVNNSTETIEPMEYHLEEVFDKPKCYSVKYYGVYENEVGHSLQFGGPGGSCD
ncbi:protein neprosin-like [Vicia villosa]|uniref:protein neprosin-like n=1 Tax=Vicia villosa TaxID=3911 RepID=UPI00273AE988|nr:protein neprosin-like [Vicia villosa]